MKRLEMSPRCARISSLTRVKRGEDRFTIGDCAAGHRAENRAKNRNVLVVPPDNYRPYLTSTMGNNDSDYVNAVFVDGFTRAEEFVVTEWPMASTAANFWSLVHDYDLRTVVVLNHHRAVSPVAGNLVPFPTFWPHGGGGSSGSNKVNYGHIFCVEQKSCTDYDGKFAAWELLLMKQDISPKKFASRPEVKKDLTTLSSLLKSFQAPPKPVQLFQINCWPNNQKVPNSTLALVQLIKEVDSWRSSCRSAPHDDDVDGPGRVLVVSDDGYSRCGIYCAAAACLEQVRHGGKVDVFQAVKTVRKSRPQLVANPTEYKYCYDVVLHYVLNYFGKGKKGGGEKGKVEEDEDEDLVAVPGGSYYGSVGEEEK